MKNLNLLIILLLVLSSCSQETKEPIGKIEFTDKTGFRNKKGFLNKFTQEGTKKVAPFKRKIKGTDLDKLMVKNEVNEFQFKKHLKYYYENKEKLDSRHYLLSYSQSYRPVAGIKNMLLNWKDVFHCIYDIEADKVVSKLRVSSSDPIITFCKEDNGIYDLKSYYMSFRFTEESRDKASEIIMTKDTIREKYKIIKNRFVLIKSEAK